MMSKRFWLFLSLCAAGMFFGAALSVALSPDSPASENRSESSVVWHDDYAQAMAEAERLGRMLLVFFCDPKGDGTCNRFKAETLDDVRVCRKLADYVCVQLPLEATIRSGGQEVKLLEHDAFREMLGRPGVAIVDFLDESSPRYGAVVSQFPITERLWYTPEQMIVILDLPPGTLTQRTLIYAVRTHPDRPASADGELCPDLAVEAGDHAKYQASVGRQGHQFWETRFHRIMGRLPRGLTAREVCAESWPGENLVEAAIECVRCWRLSAGHWSAVRSPCRLFGYDMHRGANSIWYATGIFGFR